jgi:tetratricopeptide (TPR) repeat protein
MKRIVKLHITAALAVLLFFSSCSSQPKNPGDILTLRSQAEKEMDVANKEAARGNYETALLLLNECKRKAVLSDDSGLIIRSGLSRGNVLFLLGRNDEAFAEWESAVAEAQRKGDNELLSVSKIYQARGNLVTGSASAKEVLDTVNREAGNVKNDQLYIAFSWYVKALALRGLGSYREAEDAANRSLAIHDKGSYLENAAFDWFLIASIRSLSGNTNGALEALESAIELDRRIENSWGIAADWRAKGDVYKKTGKSGEAKDAYLRAKAIYEALGNESEAAEMEKRSSLP